MEYTHLIDRLLDAERSAQGIVQTARAQEDGLEAELAAEAARLREEYLAQAQTQLQGIERQAAQETRRTLDSQDARRDEAMRRMERAYQRYGDNWVDTLFHRIADEQS